MTIQELFIRSNHELKAIVGQIQEDQWDLMLPEYATYEGETTLRDAVRYHAYDDAWVPDTLAGKTLKEVGDIYDHLLQARDVLGEFAKYNQLATEVVADFDELERTVHLSYGDFTAKQYLQHITSFRAMRAFDFAKLIGADMTMPPEYVEALRQEYESEVELYRQEGVFPDAVAVPDDADAQTKLLAMFGRKA